MDVPYDTSFSCTYQGTPEDEQDDKYRSEMLRAFKLKVWNGSVIMATLDSLFTRLKDVPGMKSVLEAARRKHPTLGLVCGNDDDRTVFQLLFSFDLFDRTHAALCDLLERGEIREERMECLSENLR